MKNKLAANILFAISVILLGYIFLNYSYAEIIRSDLLLSASLLSISISVGYLISLFVLQAEKERNLPDPETNPKRRKVRDFILRIFDIMSLLP